MIAFVAPRPRPAGLRRALVAFVVVGAASVAAVGLRYSTPSSPYPARIVRTTGSTVTSTSTSTTTTTLGSTTTTTFHS